MSTRRSKVVSHNTDLRILTRRSIHSDKQRTVSLVLHVETFPALITHSNRDKEHTVPLMGQQGHIMLCTDSAVVL
jgi:hypothetical protein